MKILWFYNDNVRPFEVGNGINEHIHTSKEQYNNKKEI